MFGHPRIRLLASLLIAVTVLATPAAGAPWRQGEFVVGTWLDPPVSGPPEALPTNVRTYGVARDAYVSLLSGWPSFFPAPPPGMTHRDVQRTRFAAAFAAGLQVMVADTAIATDRTLAQPCPPWVPYSTSVADSVLSFYSAASLTADERAALGGYYLGDEPVDFSCWTLRQRQWTQAIHERDPGKPVWINLLPNASVNLRAEWLDPSPAGTQSVPDVFSIAQYPYVNGQLVLPDGDGDGWPDHDGRRYLENMARMREVLDSTRTFWHMADAWNLEHDGNTAFEFDDPTPAHLRLYAFAPVAHGATGLVWFGYSHAFLEDRHPTHEDWTWFCATETETPCTEAAVSRGFIPTRKYSTVREIDHYLHDVVGPAVMASSYRGTWHRDAHPATGDTWMVPASRLAGASSPVVKAIGDDRAMVGVFQGKGAESATWYLLVVNKDPQLRPISTAIQLHPGLGLEVGAAPSVIGYAGGTTYGRVPLSGDVFTVDLEGGEGRLFRLTPAGTGTLLTLVEPEYGETWIQGETRTVRWDDPGAATVRLYTDVLEDSAELNGPYLDLASGVIGGRAMVTVPAITTNRARLEVSSGARRASHRWPLRIRASGNAPDRKVWPVAGADGFLQCNLQVPSPNAPVVFSFGDASRRLVRSELLGSTWSTSVIPDNSCYDRGDAGCEPVPSGSYGYSPSVQITPAAETHAAFYTFFRSPASGLGDTWGSTSSLHYGVQPSAGAPWTIERAAVTGTIDGDCAIAVDGAGAPWIAFNGGFESGYELRVLRRIDGTWGEWDGPGYTGNPQDVAAQFDAAGALWLCFRTTNPSRIYVVRKSGTTTQPMLVLNGEYRSPAFALDDTGALHLTYARPGATPGSATLHYRRLTGSTWSAEETVDGTVGSVADAAVACFGTAARVVYVRNGVLMVADRSSGTWASAVLDGSSDAEGQVSARFSSTGTLWAGYRDRATHRLMVASTTGTCAGCPVDVGPAARAHTLQMRVANPLRRGEDLRFELNLARPATVRARLFDVAGRVVAAFERAAPAGPGTASWNLSRVRSGVFFVEASLDGDVVVRRKLVVLR